MKRAKAKSVNDTTTKLNETVRNSEQLQSVGEIIPETLNRIASNEFYQQKHIVTVGNCLLKKYGYNNFKQQFEVAYKLNHLKNFVSKLNTIEQNPIFVIYSKNDNHWITFSIIKLNSKIFVLYKDSLGEKIDDDLQETMEETYGETVVEFKSHNKKEQSVNTSSGAMALQNMRIILKGIRNDKSNFINKFEEIKFCAQSEVEKIKKEFVSILRGELLKILVSDLIKDKDYEKFKQTLNELLDIYLKYASAYKPLKRYVELVMEESIKYEKDPSYVTDKEREEEIEQAKKTFVDDPNTQEIFKEQETNFQKEDLYKKFPEQIQKFIDILTYLKISENFEEELEEVSQKLNIDPNKIKIFLEILKEETKANKEKLKIKNEPMISKEINLISKDVPLEEIVIPDRYVKSLEQLLSEIQLGADQDNSNIIEDEEEMLDLSEEELKKHYRQKYQDNETIRKLEEDYREVKKFYQQWEDKNIQDIFNWAGEKKGYLDLSTDLYETIAIMNRANQLTTGHNLRDPQILAILLFAQSNKNQGKLYQIHTGEGKTIIVSLIATLKVLQGLQTDIITSNQVLARDGVQNRENFYGIFGISVSDNNPEEEIYKIGPRKCYTADIVYGTMGNFQFDYLRDLFENFGIRAKRRFDFAILDEVDSMTIDQGSYIAKLAAPFPGMDLLKYAYIKIWQELVKAEQEIYREINEKFDKKSKELLNLNLTEIEKEQEYQNYQVMIFETINEDLKKKIKENDPLNIKLIPTHLKKYSEDMLDKWIGNALYARYNCQENEQYVIKQKNGEEVIIPVDYQSTGVTLKNTIWSNALHQFIQIKHNLNITTESLTSSSISNIGYIKLYNNKIFGLTGTLGSAAEQNLLSKIYNINYVKIPTYKEKQFRELEGVVITDQAWANAIALVSFLIARKGRSTLIICQTINDLLEISKNIKSLKKLEGFNNLKIKTYQDEDNSEIVKKEVGTSEIIIATNIAGRGTDFKTSLELEKNGGLHVCLSFLPVNQRVQDQAFGRTSRQGNHGTAQLIIRSSDILDLDITIVPGMCFSTIIQKRDQIEKLRLENIQKEKLTEIYFQDNIINKFADLYKTFKNNYSDIPGGLFLAEDLKEFWAFWLQKKNFKGNEDVEEEFKIFKLDAKSILGGKITHNPYYSIRQAEYFLSNNQAEEAGKALNHAMDLSKENAEFLYSAYIKFFEVAIENGAQIKQRLNKALKKIFFVDIFTNTEKDESYKKNAEIALEKSKHALNAEINYIKTYFIGDSPPVTTVSTTDASTLPMPPSTSTGASTSSMPTPDTSTSSPPSSTTPFPNTNASTSSMPTPATRSALMLSLPANSTVSITNPQILASSSNADFLNILHRNNTLLFKHIVSRYIALITFRDHTESLLVQIQNRSNDRTKGITIGGRIPNYLKELISKKDCEKNVKESLYEAELSELGLIGLETIYALKDVHDVDEKIIISARCQIGGGLTALAIGVAFPISMPVMGQIAGAMVAEGLLDIVMELISRGDSTFNKAAYIKGKCISYGITIATMGLNAILTSTKILNQAIKACKGLSAMLRKCPYFKTVCEKLATQIDKLGEYLTTLKLAAEILKMQKIAHTSLTKTSLLMPGLKSIAKVRVNTVAISILTDKLINNNLKLILEGIKPHVQNKVKNVLNNNILQDQLKFVKTEDLKDLIWEITFGTYGEVAIDVIKEISAGILNHCKSWKVKLTSIAIDSVMTMSKICSYAQTFCDILKKHLGKINKQNGSENNTQVIHGLRELMITMITEHIYGLLTHLTLKHLNMFVLNPIAQKLSKLSRKQMEETNILMKTKEEPKNRESFADIHAAYETLGLKPGASKEEVATVRHRLLRKYHSGPEASALKFHEVKKAGELLRDHLNTQGTPSSAHHGQHFNQQATNQPNFNQNQVPNLKPASQESTTLPIQNLNENSAPAHRGNIKTLSQRHRQHIIIQAKNGEQLAEFGKSFRDRPRLVIHYLPPRQGVLGHYAVPENPARQYNIVIHPTGTNNCLYDVYSAIQQIRGITITPFEARTMAENPNLTNFMIGVINQTSEIFNNPITRNIYLGLQTQLLVGGFRNLLGHIRSTTFVERCEILCNTQPIKFGGSFSEVSKEFPDRKGVIEVHHVPAVSSYKDTMYEGINRVDMPAIAIEYEHHRHSRNGRIAVTSTGNSFIARRWREEIRDLLRRGHFAEALRLDLQDVINSTYSNPRYYRQGILELLDYCRDTTIPGSPTALITPEEYSTLCAYLLGLMNKE